MTVKAPLKPPARPDLRREIEQHGFVLLYDGVCGLCNGFVQWILKWDKTGTMRFATLQGELGQQAIKAIPSLSQIDSVILLYKDGAWIRSTAALEAARYVGGVWTLALVGYVVPRRLRDAVYDFVARKRYGWFGRYDACPIPTAEQRERFLD